MNDGMDELERELQQHGVALRGLARALVDPSDVDDVVQEATLQALRSRPRNPGPLVGWLLGIVRHTAFRHRRTRARQRLREQAAVRELVAQPDASVDESDSLRQLMAAVAELPQPYRGAVFARYLREQSPAAIAAASGESLATVKSRLRRGLVMLRERLDTDETQRGGDWRAGLVAAFGLPGTTGKTTAVVAGGVLMTTTMKWMFAAAAAALSVGGWLLFAPTARATVEPPRVAAGPTAARGAPVEVPMHSVQLSPGGGTLAMPLERTAAPPPSGSAAVLAECVVRGRCVDVAGQPLAGVTVRLAGSATDERRLQAWRQQHGEPSRIDMEVVSGADGGFVLRVVPPPFRFSMRVQGRGLATWQCAWDELAAGSTEELGDVVLAPGSLLRGRVVDADGLPVPKVEVRIRADEPGRDPRGFETWSDGRTGVGGMFVARWALLAGDYTLGIDDQRLEQPHLHLTGEAEQQVEIRLLRVDGDRSIRGIVVDDAGRPVQGVSVSSSLPDQDRVITTDAEGRFRVLRPDAGPARIRLWLHATGWRVPLTEDEYAWGRHDLRFVVTKGHRVAIEVLRASDGAPVVDYALRVAPIEGFAGLWPGRAQSPGRAEQSRTEVGDLMPGPHHVLVEPAGDDLAIGVVPVEIPLASSASVVVRLAATTERTVRVQRADGTPVVGALVQLVDPLGLTLSDRVPVHTLADWGSTSARKALVLAEARTDAAGHVTLPAPSDRPLGLRLPGPLHAPTVVPSAQFPASEPLVVTVPAGARLRGRIGPDAVFAAIVRPAGSAPSSNARNGLWPSVQLWRASAAGRDVFPNGSNDRVQADGSLQADGSFELHGVPAGRWRIVVMCPTKVGGRVQWREEDGGIVDLAEGATVDASVDLSALLPGDVEGFVMRNGVPFADETVELRLALVDHPDGERWFSHVVRTDDRGHFQATVRHGDYELRGPWRPQANVLPLLANERVRVSVGVTTRQTFTLQSARLAVQLLDAAGQPAGDVVIELRDADGAILRTLDPTDGAGRVVVETDGAPATAWVLPKRLQSATAQREFVRANPGLRDPFATVRLALGPIEPRLGATTESTLRLPSEWEH